MFSALYLALLGASLHISLEHGAKSGPLLSGQRIELLSVRGETMNDTQVCVTDHSARCRFQVSNDPELTYVARSLYGGLQYLSAIFSGAQIPKSLSIQVYDSRSGLEGLTIVERQILFSPTETGLQVEDEWLVHNSSPFALLGSNNMSFSLTLPDNAHDLRFEVGFSEEDTKIEARQIRSSRPLLPGDSRFGLAYQLETQKTTALFESAPGFKPQQIFLALPEGSLKIESLDPTSPLHESGTKFIGESRYRTWTMKPTSSELRLLISGLPLKWNTAPFLPLLSLLAFFFLFLFRKFWMAPPLGSRDSSYGGPLPPHKGPPKGVLVSQLQALKRLKAQGLIADSEFQRRRLHVMRNLAPHYGGVGEAVQAER